MLSLVNKMYGVCILLILYVTMSYSWPLINNYLEKYIENFDNKQKSLDVKENDVTSNSCNIIIPEHSYLTHYPTMPSYQQTLNTSMTDVSMTDVTDNDKNLAIHTRMYPCRESVTGFFTDCGIPPVNLY